MDLGVLLDLNAKHTEAGFTPLAVIAYAGTHLMT